MERLNLASFIFLVVLFVLTPRGALRSARQLRQARAEGKPLPRKRIVLSTMFALTVLWFLAVMNAVGMGVNVFSVEGVGLREIGIGLLAFAMLLAAIPISRAMRSPEEQRRQIVNGIAPRTGSEFAVFVALALLAGIAEESAYRGVAVWILSPVFGNVVPAMFLSAMAFSVAHAVQGGKTMAVIFGIAVVFHLLVYLTNTLVIAMVVHAAYDVVAGYAAGRKARQFEAEDAASALATPG
jgi:membrane protease YdiL (CAAX protease family)